MAFGVVLAVKPTPSPSVRGVEEGETTGGKKSFRPLPLSPSSFGLLRGKRLDPLSGRLPSVPICKDSPSASAGYSYITSNDNISLARELLR